MNDKKITSLREISDFFYSQNLKIENLTIILVCIYQQPLIKYSNKNTKVSAMK